MAMEEGKWREERRKGREEKEKYNGKMRGPEEGKEWGPVGSGACTVTECNLIYFLKAFPMRNGSG